MDHLYAVEFYDKKGNMIFCCGLRNIDDFLIEFANDPAKKAIILDLNKRNSFRDPVAVFEKCHKKRKWIRTI